MDKNEYMKQLHDNEIFKQALSMAKDDAERRIIKAYADDLMVKFYKQVFEPVNEVAKRDPEEAKKILEEVAKDLVKSGSLGS